MTIDRSEAVNLATNVLDRQSGMHDVVTPSGIDKLCRAVMAMDAAMKNGVTPRSAPIAYQCSRALNGATRCDTFCGQRVCRPFSMPSAKDVGAREGAKLPAVVAATDPDIGKLCRRKYGAAAIKRGIAICSCEHWQCKIPDAPAADGTPETKSQPVLALDARVCQLECERDTFKRLTIFNKLEAENQYARAEVAEREIAALRKTMDDAGQELHIVGWIEHHKAGNNLNWDRVDHPYAAATPLCSQLQAAAQIAELKAQLADALINGSAT